jgi:cytidine deaminase
MPTPLDELLEAARSASRSAYCPYSQFHVGAAVRAGGRIFTGANVENASYGLTICAERTAAFAAVLAGAGPIEAVAVACVDAPAGSDPTGLMPCGACRQVLAEFAAPETPVVVDRTGTFTLAELLPLAFRLRGSGTPSTDRDRVADGD